MMAAVAMAAHGSHRGSQGRDGGGHCSSHYGGATAALDIDADLRPGALALAYATGEGRRGRGEGPMFCSQGGAPVFSLRLRVVF